MSCEHDPAPGRVGIRALGTLETGFLRSLDASYHFTLAELIWHGGLTDEEHRQLFHLSAETSQLRLAYLEQLSLVEAEGDPSLASDRLFRLNPAYFQPVGKMLESMHLLY